LPTRSCVEDLWASGTTAAHLDLGDIIRACLLWVRLRSEPRPLQLAVKADVGNMHFGTTCPRHVRHRPERRAGDA
jgi:hypothetical protein